MSIKSMKKFYIFIFLVISCRLVIGQAVTLDPEFPSLTGEVTITVDLSLAEDTRAEDLLGLTDGVFLWSGVGSGTGSSAAFEFTPEGQTDFASAFEPGRMTFLGDDQWSITLIIKDYYNIPDEEEDRITTLGMLLKNADGSAQTEDFFIPLVDESSTEVPFTVTPENPTINDEITISVDVSKSSDSRAEALLGLTSGVFLWSGVGDASNPFAFGPPGQTDFFVPFPPGEMTLVDEDIWEITLTPAEYYSIDGNPNDITRLGFLLKNGSGSAQTEDFIAELSPGGFVISFVSPATDGLVFVDEGSLFPITITASRAADLQLELDTGAGFEVVATSSGLNFLTFDYPVSGGENISVRATGSSGDIVLTKSLDIEFFIKQPRENTLLPAGINPGINYDPADDTKVTLALVAPDKDFAYFVGDITNWELSDDYQMNYDETESTFWIEITDLTPEQEYIFQYWVEDLGGLVKVGDPYADKVVNPFSDPAIPESVYPGLIDPDTEGNGVATTFQTGQQEFVWDASEDAWQKPDKNDLVVYELYLGDFLGTDGGHDYKILKDTLSYLKRLGINAIELMPVAEHGFDPGWGYDPDYMFAPEKYYGTPDNLKDFIQTAHQEGMAVIHDIVLNHHTGTNPLVLMYSENFNPREDNPWFNDVPRHPFNVFADMNHESEFTIPYVDSVVQYWVDEFHFDGYRFDLSKGFTQTESTDDGVFRQFDEGRINTLTRIANKVWEIDPEAYIILEHFAASDEEAELASRGMLLWGNFHFDFAPLLNGQSPTRSINGLIDLQSSHVKYIESHDEQRIMYEMLEFGQSNGDYNIKDLNTALNRSKLAAAFFFTLPGPKMIWQWQELGYDQFLPFNNPGRTDPKPHVWGGEGNFDYYNDPDRRKVYDSYGAIIRLTQEQKDVFSNDPETQLTGSTKRIVYNSDGMDVVIIGNFDLQNQSIDPQFTQEGTWYDYLTGDSINVTDVNEAYELTAGEFHIFTSVRLEIPGEDLVPFTVEFQEEITSLSDEFNNDILIYPNPVEDRFTIQIDNAKSKDIGINLIDISGRNSFEISPRFLGNEIEVNTSKLRNGIYILELDIGGRSITRKIVLNR